MMNQSVLVTLSLDFKDETDIKNSIWSMESCMGKLGKLNCFSAMSLKNYWLIDLLYANPS